MLRSHTTLRHIRLPPRCRHCEETLSAVSVLSLVYYYRAIYFCRQRCHNGAPLHITAGAPVNAAICSAVLFMLPTLALANICRGRHTISRVSSSFAFISPPLIFSPSAAQPFHLRILRHVERQSQIFRMARWRYRHSSSLSFHLPPDYHDIVATTDYYAILLTSIRFSPLAVALSPLSYATMYTLLPVIDARQFVIYAAAVTLVTPDFPFAFFFDAAVIFSLD